MSTPLRPHTTSAFYLQAAASFGVSSLPVGIGITLSSGQQLGPRVPGHRHPVLGHVGVYPGQVRAVIVRRKTDVVSRVDQARLEKLLAEQGLLRVENI